VISAPVYVELLAHPAASVAFVEGFLERTRIVVDFVLDETVWRETGRSFAGYAQRQRASGGGRPKRLLADFLIGAHAVLRADRLLTLDASRYLEAFPGLRMMG